MMKPLARAATLLPPAALRADPGVAITAFARYAPALLTVAPISRVLSRVLQTCLPAHSFLPCTLRACPAGDCAQFDAIACFPLLFPLTDGLRCIGHNSSWADC